MEKFKEELKQLLKKYDASIYIVKEGVKTHLEIETGREYEEFQEITRNTL